MKYYIWSAIVFVLCISCFSLTEGDHALLSAELTVIIHGILRTDHKLCALYKAVWIDCSKASQKCEY